jgi:hypothetical protein
MTRRLLVLSLGDGTTGRPIPDAVVSIGPAEFQILRLLLARRNRDLERGGSERVEKGRIVQIVLLHVRDCAHEVLAGRQSGDAVPFQHSRRGSAAGETEQQDRPARPNGETEWRDRMAPGV